ncbi:MAG: glycoside hydrolase family 16 protein [Gemmatimonadetes bacterium]|nr:MAG: glycoside hydrolase family 16 protein [Gemmatimonadota bacterium]
MKTYLFWLGFGVIVLILGGCDTDSGDSTAWQLVWQDEFEGAAGEVPDPTRWGYDIGTDWGNAQLEYDTDRPENATLDGNGNLVITAREESYEGRNYTSARLVTRDKFETTYGRFEARMKMPWGQGLWPAFWLLGANIETVGWPQCGEIDIMEYRGQEPTVVHGSLHGPGYSAGAAVTSAYRLTNARFDTDFHLFAVEWTPDEIRWYLDDQLYQVVTPKDTPGEWVYDHPFYIILNLAVGGNYVGAPTANTVFPQTLVVDWVRVYQMSQ